MIQLIIIHPTPSLVCPGGSQQALSSLSSSNILAIKIGWFCSEIGLLLQIITQSQFKHISCMSIEQARRSKQRETYRQKYLQNFNENPLGRYKLLMTDYHKGDPFLTLGPNYLIFAVSFIAANLLTVALLSKLNRSEGTHTFFLIQTVILIFLDTAWLATGFINPGISSPNSDDEGEVCEICRANNGIDIVKKQDRYHCEECDVCIDDMETHIKFIGGCVGRNNFIVFKLLILGIFVWGLSMITIVPLTYNL